VAKITLGKFETSFSRLAKQRRNRCFGAASMRRTQPVEKINGLRDLALRPNGPGVTIGIPRAAAATRVDSIDSTVPVALPGREGETRLSATLHGRPHE
jgi:hypothetical protein